MKNLVKLSIVVISLTMTEQLFAQNFGLKAGLNLSKLYAKSDEGEIISDEFDLKAGYHIGLTNEFPISKYFSLESGLILSSKGFQTSSSFEDFGETYKYKLKLNLLYLDIPLTAKATLDLKNIKVYGALGPYVGIGLSGKVKTKFTYNGITEQDEDDIKWGNNGDDSELRRFDYGLILGAGIEVKSILIGFNYSLGLANMIPAEEDEGKLKNRVAGISIGYKFNSKRKLPTNKD